jgi:hypothetical protein
MGYFDRQSLFDRYRAERKEAARSAVAVGGPLLPPGAPRRAHRPSDPGVFTRQPLNAGVLEGRRPKSTSGE